MSDSYARLRDRKKPIVRTVALCLDATVADAAREARERYEALLSADGASASAVAAAKKAAAAADAARDDMSERFSFRALPRGEYQALLDAHPPSAEDVAKAEDRGEPVPEFDPSFMPALVAASIIEPALSEVEVHELWASPDWAWGELLMLFVTANSASAATSVVELGKGSTGTVG